MRSKVQILLGEPYSPLVEMAKTDAFHAEDDRFESGRENQMSEWWNLVDTPVLETGAERRVGSSPTSDTIKLLKKRGVSLC